MGGGLQPVECGVGLRDVQYISTGMWSTIPPPFIICCYISAILLIPQFSLAGMVGEAVPGFLNAKGEWPRQMATMVVDGVSIIIGSCLGEWGREGWVLSRGVMWASHCSGETFRSDHRTIDISIK